MESSSTETESELPESFIVDMQDKEGRVINSVSAKLASDGRGVYEYYTWANLGEKISFVPRDSRYEFLIMLSDDLRTTLVKLFQGCLGGWIVINFFEAIIYFELLQLPLLSVSGVMRRRRCYFIRKSFV